MQVTLNSLSKCWKQYQKVTLNAKIETLDKKPSFREFINKSCLIIANGFYKWRWHDSVGKSKIKYEIGHKHD
jgi:putative SOS response-associated peptidase YedK